MKWLFRWVFRLVILLIVLAVAAVMLLNPIAREVAEYRLSRQTGLEVKIGRVDVGLLNPRVTFENLVIYNSADFGGAPLLDLPELHVEYDAAALWSHRLHWRLIRLNLARGSVVEDRKGRLNLELLQEQLRKSGGTGSSATNQAPGFKFLGIDTLNLSVGRVDFYSMKNPSRVDTLHIDFRNQVRTNLHTPDDLGSLYLGGYEWILLHNGINPRDTNDASNPWPYWMTRLEELGKK